MELPNKYLGVTPGKWTPALLDEWAMNVCTSEGVNDQGTERFWAVASMNTQRPEADKNLVLMADSKRLAAAVVMLRTALLNASVIIQDVIEGNQLPIQSDLNDIDTVIESTEEWSNFNPGLGPLT